MVILNNKNIKELTGVVVSDIQDKTIVVKVSVVKMHPLYKKRYNVHKKYYVHDQENEATIGSMVKFRQAKPISKLKKRRMIEIVK